MINIGGGEMADDAGFGVALTIRQSVLNDALLVAYDTKNFPRIFDDPLLFGPPDAALACSWRRLRSCAGRMC